MSNDRKVTMVILDGFGLLNSEKGNAIIAAKMPNLEAILSKSYLTALGAYGAEVGLTWGNMGNSEVGHLGLGTGRVIQQDFPRINDAISSKEFFSNEAWQKAADFAKSGGGAVHVAGLVSDGGVHGDWQHLVSAAEAIRQKFDGQIWLHLFSDGRDTPPEDFDRLVKKVESEANGSKATIATVSGRYYALDRDQRWERTHESYSAIIEAKGRKVASIDDAISEARKNKETDEFIKATVIGDYAGIKDGDAVVFTNFRSDRMRQTASAFANKGFKGFKQILNPEKIFVATMTTYGIEGSKNFAIAFPSDPAKNTLAEAVSAANKKQIHIAETEKYAHITYFFNGGHEKEFPSEDRILVASPKVETYDKKPEMSASGVVSEYLKAAKKNYDLIVVNFANCDMVGHTGKLEATIKAVETVDESLGKIIKEIDESEGVLIVTADHGNAELMVHPGTSEEHKEHTVNPVPFILYDPQNLPASANESLPEDKVDEKSHVKNMMNTPPTGLLADAAPTVLELLGINPPAEMSGVSLLSTLGYQAK